MGRYGDRSPALPVGRQAELDLLEQLLDDIAHQTSAALVIEGHAGQGKSCLLDWTAQTATDRGWTLVRTTGVQFEREAAFAALSPMLLPFAPLLDRLDDGLAQTLRAALGWVEGGANRVVISTAVVSLLSAVAGDPDLAPVLVVVDDAQWVDQSSLEALVSAAMRRRVDVRLGFLFAQRPGSGCVIDDVSLPRIELAGLDRDAVVELLGGKGVAAGVAERCWAVTQGNPLALLEGVRGLSKAQRSGDAPLPPALPIPRRLLTTYLHRLLELPDATQRALSLAAMESDDLGVVMAAVTAVGGHDDDLLPAEQAGVVIIEGGRLRWDHPMLLAAADQLSVGEPRRRLQRALADASTAAGYHDKALWLLSEAVRGPDETIASQLADQGAHDRRRGAPRAAAQTFERAARLSTIDADRHQRLYLAAEAWWATGDHDKAVALVRPVIAQVDDVKTRAQMAIVLGTANVWVAGPATALSELERYAEQVAPQQPDQAVYLLFQAVSASLLMLDSAKADQMASRAVAAAEAAADPALQFGAGAISTVTRILNGASGDAMLIDALESFGRIAVAALAMEATDADMLAQLCAYGLVMADRYRAAETLVREIIGLDAASTSMGPRVLARVLLAELLCRSGRWASSREELVDLLTLQEAIGPRELIPATRAVYARICAGLGDDAECRSAAAAALRVASRLRLDHIGAIAHSAIGLLELGAGRHAEAAEAFDQVASLAGGTKEAGWLWWQGDAIEAFAGAGRRDDALRSLGQLETIATTTARVWAFGAVERAKGILQQDDQPEVHFAAALERFRSIEVPFEEARTLLARGRYRRAHGNREAGNRDLAAAHSLFTRTEMRARSWADQTTAAMRETTGSFLGQLEPRRREVAIAAAEGRTNKQIAELLHMSPKTVAWHLGEIYKEHGGRRAELIARVLKELDGPAEPPRR